VDRQIRRGSLADVGAEPVAVELNGWICSPNAIASPLTGVPAAMIHWAFFLPATSGGFFGGPGMEELIDSGLLGREVVFATDQGRVRLPVDSLDYYYVGANLSGHRVTAPLPEPFSRVAYLPQAFSALEQGRLHYRERLIREGDRLLLRATVMRLGHEAGGYRTTAPYYAADVTVERPSLSEQIPTPPGYDG